MVHTVIPLPGPTDQFLVCNRTSTAYITTAQGQVGGIKLASSSTEQSRSMPRDRVLGAPRHMSDVSKASLYGRP
jgi:hypothetical protein